jgi:hypothetical protein
VSDIRERAQYHIDRHREALRRLGEGVPPEAGHEGAVLARLTNLIAVWPDVVGRDNRSLLGMYAEIFAQLLNDLTTMDVHVQQETDGDGMLAWRLSRLGFTASRGVGYDDLEEKWVVTE